MLSTTTTTKVYHTVHWTLYILISHLTNILLEINRELLYNKRYLMSISEEKNEIFVLENEIFGWSKRQVNKLSKF